MVRALHLVLTGYCGMAWFTFCWVSFYRVRLEFRLNIRGVWQGAVQVVVEFTLGLSVASRQDVNSYFVVLCNKIR